MDITGLKWGKWTHAQVIWTCIHSFIAFNFLSVTRLAKIYFFLIPLWLVLFFHTQTAHILNCLLLLNFTTIHEVKWNQEVFTVLISSKNWQINQTFRGSNIYGGLEVQIGPIQSVMSQNTFPFQLSSFVLLYNLIHENPWWHQCNRIILEILVCDKLGLGSYG